MIKLEDLSAYAVDFVGNTSIPTYDLNFHFSGLKPSITSLCLCGTISAMDRGGSEVGTEEVLVPATDYIEGDNPVQIIQGKLLEACVKLVSRINKQSSNVGQEA